MKPRLLSASLALLALLAVPPVSAQTELVTNGGLDSFDGSGLAVGWNRWWEAVPNPNTGSLDYASKPDWAPESNPALNLGGQSQHIGTTWNPWHAGIYQVLNAPPGALIHVAASGRAYASNDNFPTPSDGSDQSRMQIGADPNGGTDWWAGGVQWSGQANPLDTWQTFSLDVTAGPGGKVTLFLSANYRGNSRLHQDIWWDNVSAQVLNIAPTATVTSPPPTVAPTAANPTEAPTAAVTPTEPPAQPASPPPSEPPASVPTLAPTPDNRPAAACVTVFEDTNGNGVQDGAEPVLTASTVSLDSNTGPVPHCFESLAPGEHTLTASLPAGYFATTGNTLTFALAPGQRAELQIGAQSSRIAPAAATAAPTSEPADSGGGLLVGVGLAVAVVLVVGGVAAFAFIRSRRP